MPELHHVVRRDDFKRLYNLEDPRPYYRSLYPLGYRISEPVCLVLQSLQGALSKVFGKERPQLLDFACGYGVNGALLCHDIGLAELYEHYCGAASEGLDWQAFRKQDLSFFAARRRPDLGYVVSGLDVAEKAVTYGLETGLLEQGHVVDLTQDVNDPALRDQLSGLDLIVETGAYGEHLPPSYDQLLRLSDPTRRPWFLMCSRPDVDDAPLERVLRGHDYVIERITSAPVRYRRLIGAREREDIFADVRALGADPADHFEDDHFLVHLLLARSRGDTQRWPLADLLQVIPDAIRSGGG